MDLSETAVRRWVEEATVDAGEQDGLTTEERDELRRLRRENRILRDERDILKRAATFFAMETPGSEVTMPSPEAHAIGLLEQDTDLLFHPPEAADPRMLTAAASAWPNRAMQTLSRRRFGALVAVGAALALPGPLVRARTAGAAESCLDVLLGRRRMVRRFKPDPVRDETMRHLLRAAVRAPSAGNTQPWSFVVVRDPATRAALGRAAAGQMFVAAAPIVVVACADPSRARARYGERAERYAVIDTAFASLCLLLAVTEAGLGACFVGAIDDAEVRQLVGLPPDVRPLAVIPIGYPAETPGRSRLRPLDEVIHRERWNNRTGR